LIGHLIDIKYFVLTINAIKWFYKSYT